ncbi:MAG: terminase small subunit [Aequoribacter sp.]|uniref:terminase small subunit n=1 Tax=Aequoribacter sp. TaxID=2847771 RepID=UPI003C63E49D
MPAGRPTKYKGDESVAMVHDYITNFAQYDDMIPSVEGLSMVIGVAVSTLYLWKDEHEEFSEVLGQLQIAQRRELVNKGLDGTFNSNITKLVLTKHGYSDKQDTNVNATFNLSDEPTPDEWEEEHS